MTVLMHDHAERLISQRRRFLVPVVSVLVAALAAFLVFTLYERFALGELRLAIGKAPAVTPYYLARLAVAVVLAFALVAGMFRLRAGAATIERRVLSGANAIAVYGLLALALAFAVLFVANAGVFSHHAREDRAVEWISAVIPMGASALFAWTFFRIRWAVARDARHRVALWLTPALAVLLFVMGMEEISWMQRIFAIETPALFAGNQQQEMNLHNMHSVVIGTVHRTAVFAGLIVLPFVAEVAPRFRLLDLVSDFVPGRFVLAASAPLVAFNYNEWNFFPTPFTVGVAVFILGCYLLSAWRRGDRRETALFASLLVFLVVALGVFLGLGDRFVRKWDTQEYMELFMAIGLALFAWQASARLRARHLPPAPRAA